MFLFAAYAIAVWYAVAINRRNWRGFAWILIAALALVAVAYLHWLLNVWTEGRIYFRVLQVMLYPYSVVVVGISLYIACLPRRACAVECQHCRYDLAGIAEDSALCPECGVRFQPDASIRERDLSRGRAATPSRPAAPPPAGPRWSASGSPAVCHHSADG